MPHLFFFIALAFILAHEMDAIRCQEWTIFPLLSRLDDTTGYALFTILHVPLYLGVFWGLFGGGVLNATLILGLDLFFLIHVLLHLFFLKHPKNQFKSALSWTLILGAGVGGLLDVISPI